MADPRSTDEAREDDVLDAFERAIEFELRRYVPDTAEKYPGTKVTVKARLALDVAERLRVVLKEHDEALQENHNELESEIDAMDSRRASERERAEKAEAELLRAEEALDEIDTDVRGQAVDDALAYVGMRAEVLAVDDPLRVLADTITAVRIALSPKGQENG